MANRTPSTCTPSTRVPSTRAVRWRSSHCGGFTIVELLVVIGIIGVLAGLLLPALAGAKRRSQKAEESSRVRQVGVGWSLYANANDDQCLPGYISEDVQTGQPYSWKVGYKFKDKSVIDPAIATTWVWRLMPFFDHSHDIVHGYTDEAQTGDLAAIDEAEEISLTPAFGYNAYYVGGWWDEVVDFTDPDGDPPITTTVARPRFWDARDVDDTSRKVRVVATSPSSIRNSARLVVFCSSSDLPIGEHHDVDDYLEGSHWVSAPIRGETRMWQRTQADTVISTLRDTAAPIGRYTDQCAIVLADLHTEPEAPGALDDMQRWVDAATAPNWKHAEGP